MINEQWWQDKTVLITGGASGLGRLMVHEVLSRGAKNVIVLDFDEAGMQALSKELKDAHKLTCINVDLNNVESIQAAAQKVREGTQKIDALFNNAGIVVGKDFEEHSFSDIQKTLQVNTIAPMQLTLELLPLLKQSEEAFLINISSAAALVSTPKMSVYCSSKWALVGWSDSLRLELENDKDSNVHVMTVQPYYIDTGMFNGVRSPLIPILKPEYVIKKIFKGMQKKKIFIYMPRIVYVVPLLYAILPTRIFDYLVGGIFGVYKSMNEFKGRKG